MSDQLNIFGEELKECSCNPMTGFFRTGCCETSKSDHGSHTVCTIVNQDFLNFSFSSGNDLLSPVPNSDFPGLVPGNRWCLCAPRWQEAFEAGFAPRVILESTHQGALEFIKLEDLKEFAIDLS